MTRVVSLDEQAVTVPVPDAEPSPPLVPQPVVTLVDVTKKYGKGRSAVTAGSSGSRRRR
jgi:hypothetical protein